MKVAKQHYKFINHIVKSQTGSGVLNYSTPFFGDAVKTHVAGTHGKEAFGLATDESITLNVLCGKHLVMKYLIINNINFQVESLKTITENIKTTSAGLGRCVTKSEVSEIVSGVGGVQKE